MTPCLQRWPSAHYRPRPDAAASFQLGRSKNRRSPRRRLLICTPCPRGVTRCDVWAKAGAAALRVIPAFHRLIVFHRKIDSWHRSQNSDEDQENQSATDTTRAPTGSKASQPSSVPSMSALACAAAPAPAAAAAAARRSSSHGSGSSTCVLNTKNKRCRFSPAAAMAGRGGEGGRVAFEELPVLALPPRGCPPDVEAAFCARLREVCHTIGFFYVSDHTVPIETCDNAIDAAAAFFALPDDAKTAIDNRNSPAFRGYIRLGAENTAGLPDHREQIEFGVEAEAEPISSSSTAPPYRRLIGPNQWPEQCPGQGLTLVHVSAQRKHFLWDTLVGVSLSVTTTA